jgi:hypothetical protein
LLAQPRPALAEPPAREPRLETVFRRTVELDSLPILESHVIDGHAVLPMAIIMEWLAEGAVHRNPGLVVRGLDHLQLYKGVIIGGSQEAAVEVRVGKAVRSGDHFIVPAELKGKLANGREVAHARADIILAGHHETAPRERIEAKLNAYPLQREQIYQTILFHGPAMQGIERVEGLGEQTLAGWVATSPAPSEWLEQPLRNTWLTDPLAIDCAFQLVVLWCRERLGANSLPTAVGDYRQFRRTFPANGVRVVAKIRHSSETRAVTNIEFLDARGDLVARIDSYECVVDASLNQAFRRNQLGRALSLSRSE